MYLRLGLHVQIRLYYVLPYKAKISAQHGIGFILNRCIVYLGLTMPNLQKQRLLSFDITKCTSFFLEPSIVVIGYEFLYLVWVTAPDLRCTYVIRKYTAAVPDYT